jgi:hypothetical protein
MMLIVMNYYEEANAWSNQRAYLRVPVGMVRVPEHPHLYPEEDFKSMCRTATANICDDIDERVIPLNSRVKRPLYTYHGSIIRNSPAYMERLHALIRATIPLTTDRAIYLLRP